MENQTKEVDTSLSFLSTGTVPQCSNGAESSEKPEPEIALDTSTASGHVANVGNVQSDSADALETAECIEQQTSVPNITENISNSPDEGKNNTPESARVSYLFQNARQITGAWKAFSSTEENFTKGCKWAPDGTCVLTNSADNVLRVFDLPLALHCQESWSRDAKLPEMEPALSVTEGGLVYDYCWYPLMTSWDPLSCCFAATSQDSPVHLWDAFTGQLRCSYRPYNHLDEVVTPLSLAFSLGGDKLYCGLKDTLLVFNTNRPGRDCECRRLKHSTDPSERQCGIISAIAVNPIMSSVYALGSYQRTVGLYSETDKTVLCILKGQCGGITHIQFSPDGTLLYSGGRKDPEILCWDLRNPGKLLGSLRRQVTTNQRVYFDLTPCGRYLVSGGTDGLLRVWDTLQGGEPCCLIQAHSDCINGISVHPQYPLLASSSGQRHLSAHLFDVGEELEEGEEDEGEPGVQENCLKLWWVGHS